MKKKAASSSSPAVKPLARNSAKPKASTTAKPVQATIAAAPVEMKPISVAVAEAVANSDIAPAKPAAKKPATKQISKSDDAKEKVKKPKLVRDSFTMPEAEYAALADIKKNCLKAGIDVKKSELLRVGVALLRDLDTVKIQELVGKLTPLKTGRPKKDK